jgi:hypothetical protein
MRLTVAVMAVVGCACSRPPAANTEPVGGLELHTVKLDAWRKGHKTVSGTAPRVSLQTATFEASDVKLDLVGGTRVDASMLTGSSDGRSVRAPNGGVATTHDDCVATTQSPTRYDGTHVRVDGEVAFDGCGIALTAKGVSYEVENHHAEFDGPVHSRVEAQP